MTLGPGNVSGGAAKRHPKRKPAARKPVKRKPAARKPAKRKPAARKPAKKSAAKRKPAAAKSGAHTMEYYRKLARKYGVPLSKGGVAKDRKSLQRAISYRKGLRKR
jgi:hypothetical protein